MLSNLYGLYAKQNISVKFYVAARSRLLKLARYLLFLPGDGLIIDVGCGYGVLANFLSMSLPGAHIVGIDMNSKRISVAKQTIGKRGNIEFLECDASKFTWPACSAIIMTDFLHHVSPYNQKLILERATQNMARGGVLLISEVDPAAKPIYRYWNSFLSDRILYPLSKSYFKTSEYWHDILNSLNFKVETVCIKNTIFAPVVYVCTKG